MSDTTEKGYIPSETKTDPRESQMMREPWGTGVETPDKPETETPEGETDWNKRPEMETPQPELPTDDEGQTPEPPPAM